MSEADDKYILYEDDKMVAFVPERPFTKGHIVIQNKEGQDKIEDMDEKDFQHLIYGSSFAATALFENLQSHGTNIIMNTGGQLKKNGGPLKIDVLSRMGDDGLKLMWTPKKFADAEMDDVMNKIKSKTGMIGVAKKKKEVLDLDNKKVETIPGAIGEEVEAKSEIEDDKKTEKKTEEDPKEELKTEEKIPEPKNEVKEEKEESYLIKQLKRLP